MSTINSSQEILPSDFLKKFQIQIYEPFAEHLGGGDLETRFSLSLLDAFRMAGHGCPSMTGAFLITQAAVKNLFPDEICVRGMIEVDIPAGPTDGATGPMANVISFITGAWNESGFGGLGGEFRRRNLLRFNSSKASQGGFNFKRVDTGKEVTVSYHPERISKSDNLPFPENWRLRVRQILENKDSVIDVLE